MIVIHNDGDEATADLRLRLRFTSGDDWPSWVLSGIRGYGSDGTLILEPNQLVVGERMDVLVKVPHQGAEGWSVFWSTEDGVAHDLSGGIEFG